MEERISKNFDVAKIASILMVAAGHFFPGTVLWVPVSVGLFVFAFSSAFFTSAKYQGTFDLAPFWNRKVNRLVPDLLIVNIFLFCLFIIQNRHGVFTFDSIINVFGFSGFLNWFGIRNASPFGDGLWFFTLLIIFYFAYPVINLLNNRVIGRFSLLLAGLVATIYFHFTIQVGHVLWLTMFGFLFGTFVERSGVLRFDMNPNIFAMAVFSTITLMIVLNYVLGFKGVNYFLILGACVFTVFWLLYGRVNQVFVDLVRPIAPCLIEIYFIHTYLFIRPAKNTILDFFVTIFIVIGVAFLLEHIARRLRSFLMSFRRAGIAA